MSRAADLGTGRELFVYYRVADANSAAAGDAIGGMQRRLVDAHPGLVARVLRRPESNDSVQTWMEAYALPGRGIDAALEAAIALAARAMAGSIIGERHVEVFVEGASPST